MSQLLKRKLRPACININQVEDESTSRNCQIHYTLKLDDLYEVNASIKGSASTCLNSIVTIIRSSDSGTEVKVLFRIPNKKTSFVNFNFPAVKLNKLNVLDLQILADIQDTYQTELSSR
ncbi:hypothetical protein Bpfe_008930 [Biomphalaria pfeifferi]|uniref:Uncharacterized protein n=1 Tax=Biomphalaria pfeifferi TaxID=112525 RepID=A0AAD8FF40_BIOPF|nr:hypothetical protein Bpfe_008930 [Biomphalaria pfeifferi]